MLLWIAWCVSPVVGMLCGGVCWHYGRHEGRHEGTMTERERWIERNRRAAERRMGPSPQIRAKTGPLPVGPGPQGKNAPWAAGGLAASPETWRVAPPRHVRSQPRRMVTTSVSADDIAPVIWPQPGTQVPMRPQAPRTSGAGTGTLATLTTTGELRMLTGSYLSQKDSEHAAYMAARAADDEAWRRKAGLTS